MLEKHDVRRNRNGRAGGAPPAPFRRARRSAPASPTRASRPQRSRRPAAGSSCDAISPPRVTTASRGSSGSCGQRPSPARTARACSSSGTSRCPRAGAQTGDQRGGPEVFPRHRRDTRARALGAPADLPRGRHHHRPGEARADGKSASYFADAESAAVFNAELKHLLVEPEDGLQLAGLVQRRRRGGAAVLGLLHQQRRRHDGVDPRPGQDRGHAVQVRLRHRHQPLPHPLVAGAPAGRRHRLGPGLLHAGLRRLRRRHQVGRQDPPRRQDGDPQHRSPRHRRVHLVQGQGGEEGLGADRRRLRRLVQRRGLQVGLLPELEQLGARHRRVHGGGRAGPRLARPAPCATGAPVETSRRANCGATSPRRPGMCGDPGLQFDTTINDWHTSRTRRASTPRTPAASTCTSTTRPATWPR